LQRDYETQDDITKQHSKLIEEHSELTKQCLEEQKKGQKELDVIGHAYSGIC
jgi:hypothetical protein